MGDDHSACEVGSVFDAVPFELLVAILSFVFQKCEYPTRHELAARLVCKRWAVAIPLRLHMPFEEDDELGSLCNLWATHVYYWESESMFERVQERLEALEQSFRPSDVKVKLSCFDSTCDESGALGAYPLNFRPLPTGSCCGLIHSISDFAIGDFECFNRLAVNCLKK